jgi:hypothetical protein
MLPEPLGELVGPASGCLTLRGRGQARSGVGRASGSRNATYADLLLSSEMRLTEAASLLTFEVPRMQLEGGRYYIARRSRQPSRWSQAHAEP